MDDTPASVTVKPDPGGGLVMMVKGYLDETGGSVLVTESRAASCVGGDRVCVDLRKVHLFNCSGARCLISVLRDLSRSGCEVELVGVRPPLQRLLDLAV
jgi:anti-anti-sigma regulatory factor